MRNSKKRIVSFLLCLVFPSVAYANIVWPALYTETKVSSVPIIFLSLVIEIFFFRLLFKINIKKAIYYAFFANAASGIIGFVLRPLSGLVWKHKINTKNYFFTWIINTVTVAIATIWVIVYPQTM